MFAKHVTLHVLNVNLREHSMIALPAQLGILLLGQHLLLATAPAPPANISTLYLSVKTAMHLVKLAMELQQTTAQAAMHLISSTIRNVSHLVQQDITQILPRTPATHVILHVQAAQLQVLRIASLVRAASTSKL